MEAIVIITEMPNWGFGNRVLYYYNLRQYAQVNNYDFFCPPWDGYQHFLGNMVGNLDIRKPVEHLPPCLGEKFFWDSGISTREVFKLKQERHMTGNNCAVHFRGTDFFKWNARAVLNKEYYLNAIDEVKGDTDGFILCCDDTNLESFKAVCKHLEQENIFYYVGENTHDRTKYIEDFTTMSQCDIIISSPSTYCISAGFIGKEKKIIHTKEWLDYRVEEDDKFWVDLYNGGNEDYKLWKMV